MCRRKIRRGALITSLDQLAKCDWIIVNIKTSGSTAKDKPMSRGWWISWQLQMVMTYIKQGYLHEGIRLTNGEYFEGMSEEKLLEKFGDEIRAEGLEKWKERKVA